MFLNIVLYCTVLALVTVVGLCGQVLIVYLKIKLKVKLFN